MMQTGDHFIYQNPIRRHSTHSMIKPNLRSLQEQLARPQPVFQTVADTKQAKLLQKIMILLHAVCHFIYSWYLNMAFHFKHLSTRVIETCWSQLICLITLNQGNHYNSKTEKARKSILRKAQLAVGIAQRQASLTVGIPHILQMLKSRLAQM